MQYFTVGKGIWFHCGRHVAYQLRICNRGATHRFQWHQTKLSGRPNSLYLLGLSCYATARLLQCDLHCSWDLLLCFVVCKWFTGSPPKDLRHLEYVKGKMSHFCTRSNEIQQNTALHIEDQAEKTWSVCLYARHQSTWVITLVFHTACFLLG